MHSLHLLLVRALFLMSKGYNKSSQSIKSIASQIVITAATFLILATDHFSEFPKQDKTINGKPYKSKRFQKVVKGGNNEGWSLVKQLSVTVHRDYSSKRRRMQHGINVKGLLNSGKKSWKFELNFPWFSQIILTASAIWMIWRSICQNKSSPIHRILIKWMPNSEPHQIDAKNSQSKFKCFDCWVLGELNGDSLHFEQIMKNILYIYINKIFWLKKNNVIVQFTQMKKYDHSTQYQNAWEKGQNKWEYMNDNTALKKDGF